METEQAIWTGGTSWEPASTGRPDARFGALGDTANLVLAFGSTKLLSDNSLVARIRELYPKASILGCSTAGEICDTRVLDDSVAVTAVRFDSAEVRGTSLQISDPARSYDAGRDLAQQLAHKNLRHVFVLSDGIHVNGSDLVRGLTEHLPSQVSLTGGLSGDGERFHTTRVLWGDRSAPETVAAIGLYGAGLRVGYGSLGGWDPFGPDRLITRSKGNVLYEVDGQSAL
ncbi:MAG TPA: FIST N-terminal domain-containing protein, partial [Kiritimatiellia bacterium]